MLKEIVEIQNLRIKSDQISISWDLNTRCNFDCSYCPPNTHDNHSALHSWETIQVSLKKLIEYSRHINRKIKLTLSGGEPFLNSWLGDLIESIGQKSEVFDSLQILTNLGFHEKTLEKVLAKHTHQKIVFVILPSFHREFMDPNQFIEKVLWIKTHFPQVKLAPTVLLHPDPEGWGMSMKIHSTLANSTYLDLRPIRKNFDQEYVDYNPEQMAFIQNYLEKQESTRLVFSKVIYDDGSSFDLKSPALLFAEKKNYWKGWDCSAGFESLHITSDLTVCRAICGKHFPLHQLGKLPELNLENLTFSSKCLKDRCSCNVDMTLNKRRLEAAP